jgi:hypothetical protein
MTSALSLQCFAPDSDRDQRQGLMNVHELSGKWLTDRFAADGLQRFVILCRKSFTRPANPRFVVDVRVVVRRRFMSTAVLKY